MRLTIIGCLLLVATVAMAQKDKPSKKDTVKEGKVYVVQDELMEVLLEQDAQEHKDGKLDGFRVQVAAGTNRTNVYQTKADFYKAFNDIPTYVIFETPNFKLRVGNYRTKLEAYKALVDIKTRFPGAFIVKEELDLSELHQD